MERHVFDAAVARYSRRVYTYACYLLGDRGEAEDVAQEVLIKLWDRGSKVDSEKLGAWLLTVTRNACTDLLRKRRRAAEIVPIRKGPEIPPPFTPGFRVGPSFGIPAGSSWSR